MGAQPPAGRLLGEHAGVRGARPHPHAERPRGQRGVLRLHAAEQPHHVGAAGQPGRGEPLGGEAPAVHAVEGAGAHRHIVAPATDAVSAPAMDAVGAPATDVPAPAAAARPSPRPPWSAERTSRHPPSRYTWATHGRSRADVPDIVAPPLQTRPHEYPPPAHRSPQPPPCRPLRRHGQVAVAVRVRSARVVIPEWLARGADGSARPPEPGPGGVAVRPGGNRGSPGRTSPSRVAARAATRRARGAHDTGPRPPDGVGAAPCRTSGRNRRRHASSSSLATDPATRHPPRPGTRPLRRRVVQ